MGTSSFTLPVDANLSTVYDYSVRGLKTPGSPAFESRRDTFDVKAWPGKYDRESGTEDDPTIEPFAGLANQLSQSRLGRLLWLGLPTQDDFYVGAREVMASLLSAEGPTEYLVLVCADRPAESALDWDRWHDLLDIRDRGGFTPDEQVEYDRFAQIVATLDDEDAAVSAPAIEGLVKKHKRVLASIQRLTKAVRAAADRA